MPAEAALSHRHDPDTSGAAADAVQASGLADDHESLILEALADMPDGGTGKEIAAAIRRRYRHFRIDSVAVMRRMKQLIANNEVYRWLDDVATDRAVALWNALKDSGQRVGVKPSILRKRDGQVIHYLAPDFGPLFQPRKADSHARHSPH